MRFEIFLTRKKEWRWRLRADNGRIIAGAGESYKNRGDCDSMLQVVRSLDSDTPIVETKK